MKDTLIINAVNVYGLGHSAGIGEADAFANVGSENRCHFLRGHASQFYAAGSETQIPSNTGW